MKANFSLVVSALGFLLWMSPKVRGEDGASGVDFGAGIDLPRLVSYARVNNPEIRAMEQRWRAAQARPSQEGSLPDPMISTAYHNESFDQLPLGSNDFTYLRFGAEQELPFPGKLGLKESVAAHDANREEHLYRATVLNVTSRLRVAYADYFLAYKSIAIVQQNKALFDQIARTADAKFQVGDGLQQDVIKAQVEVSLLRERLISLEQKRESLAANLNALLNRSPLAALGEPAPVEEAVIPGSLEELERRTNDASPLLKAAESSVGRQESNLDLAKREYYPDFVVRADYYNKGGLVPEWEVGVGVRVPLYFWRKQSYGVQEAAASLNEAQAARQNTAQDVLARLKDLYVQATTAEKLISLYDSTVLPQARLSLESASAGYQVGKVDFLTVLSSFSVLLEYELRSWEERASFEQTVAQIEEVVGLPETESPISPSARAGTERGNEAHIR